MTSLYPGLLFYSVGLNKKSTPVKPETSPSEIDRKLGRAPFNGRPWPRPSPISSVYDVRNSSTRMIILNNKLSRKPKGSRLRGQTDHDGEIVLPEPERHIVACKPKSPEVKPKPKKESKPQTNWEHHSQCNLSVSKKFVPIFPPTVTPTPAWVNQTQRPAMKFDNGSGVNPNHHIQCQGHMDYDIMRWYSANAHHRRVGGASGSRPASRADGTTASRALSPILNNPALSRGERRYLNSIAKIYSVDNMRQQKQVQYNNLIWKEISKGGYKEGEWEKYQRYLNTPRKTQFGPCDPFREKRSVSVPGLNRGGRDDNRPYTSQTANRSAVGSSRSTSTAPAKASRHPRPSTRGRGQKASSGKQGGTSASGPARMESPLPPPEQRKRSASSLSSLGEEDADERKAEESNNERDNIAASQQQPDGQDETNNQTEQHTEKVESSPRATTTIAVEEEEERRKGSADEEDDERSKMSARDPAVSDEQRGVNVGYRPTYGEREGEHDRVGDGQNLQSSHQPSQGQETYTQHTNQGQVAHAGPSKEKMESQNGSAAKQTVTSTGRAGPQHEERDYTRPESPNSIPATSTASVKDDVEEVVRLAKTPESFVTADTTKGGHHGDDTKTSTSHERLSLHKEGKDRPLSRLGGREQFMVVKKDRENSDDDYSDDEGDDENAERGQPPAGLIPQEDQSTTADAKSKDGAARTTSNMTSKDGAELQGRGVKQEKAPTEASTQEKPSDISTIEY